MPRYADIERADVESKFPEAQLSGRGRRHLQFDLPNGQVVLRALMYPVHDTAGNVIDTDWQAVVDGQWRQRVETADIRLSVALAFSVGQIAEWRHIPTNENVDLQPQQLQWVGSNDSIAAIANPANVIPVVSGESVKWTGAFGTGIDFELLSQLERLKKLLTIDSLARLGTPPPTMPDPHLRLTFILRKSAGLTAYLDGQAWTEAPNNTVTTANEVEFRLANGTPLLAFERGSAWDSSPRNPTIPPPAVLTAMRRSGNSRFVEIRVPYAWLQSAVYPVYIDPTVNAQVGASDRDGYDYQSGILEWFTNYAGDWYMGAYETDEEHGGMMWSLAIPQGATISSANIQVYVVYDDATDSRTMTVKMQAANNAQAFANTSGNMVSDRAAYTTATHTFSLGDVPGTSQWWTVTEVIDELQEVVNRAGWVSGNYAMVAFIAPTSADTHEVGIKDYGGTPSLAAKLDVVYSTGGLSATVNQANETDSAQAVAKRKSKAIGQNTETDAAQVVAKRKSKAIGQNTETDSAQAITARKVKALGIASETDEALGITEVGPITVSLGQVSETDEALQVSRAKYHAVGQASETDAAFAVVRVKYHAVNQVSETDEALQVSRVKQKAVGQNAETDSALGMTPHISKVVAVGQVSETDEAFPVARVKYHAVGQAEETDSAQALGTQIIGTVNQVTETDEAFQVSRVKYHTVGQVSEADSVQAIKPAHSKTVGQATETDSPFALTGRKVVVIGQAEETDSALAFGTTITEQVGQASEADEALGITARKLFTISPVAETDLAQALFPLKRVAVAQAVETDSAQSIRFGIEVLRAISLSLTAAESIGIGTIARGDITRTASAVLQISLYAEDVPS